MTLNVNINHLYAVTALEIIKDTEGTTYMIIHTGILLVLLFTLDGLLVPLEKIEIGIKIGGGTFGSVYKGMLFGTDDAIKIVTIPDGDVKREAMKEVEILRYLSHGIAFIA